METEKGSFFLKKIPILNWKVDVGWFSVWKCPEATDCLSVFDKWARPNFDNCYHLIESGGTPLPFYYLGLFFMTF